MDVVLVHGTNPRSPIPAATASRRIHKVRLKVSFSSYLDETAALCDLFCPTITRSNRGTWSAHDGVSGVVQPTIRRCKHQQRSTFC